MATLEFPKQGKHVGRRAGAQPKGTSRDLNNVRPYWDGRACGGQRPPVDKKYTQRIGGNANYPVMVMGSVTVVD